MPLINGKEVTYSEIERIFGIKSATLRSRIKRDGMDIKEAILTPLTTPQDKGKKRVKKIKLKSR